MSITKVVKPIAPAYAPFSALDLYIDHVVKNGVPDEVDTNVLTEIGESVRSHLMTGLRFLGLATADRKPTELLRRFSQASEYERRQLYEEMLSDSYSFILDEYPKLSGLTLEVLDSKFESLGINGSTIKKCRRFFLDLANQVGWKMEIVERPQKTIQQAVNGHSASVPAKSEQGELKTITLKNAGSLSLALNVSLLELRGEDRAFVFSLIDQLQDYEDKAAKTSG